MSNDHTPPDWSNESVLRMLQERVADPAEPVGAQLFLGEGVAPEDIAAHVRHGIDQALADEGVSGEQVKIGMVRSLARSINVELPVPVLRRLLADANYTAILPDNLDNVMIKPV